MVISFTFLTTIISTIIVITMASIFFCCWTKKSSGEIQERKTKPTKEKSTKDKSVSSGSPLEKPKNGVVAETPSEMTLPLLSESALEDSSDPGDFSAVPRETEILRPYRKPPPPRRARQTRTPKVLQTGRKSLDIFTELYGDDSNQSSDKENTDSTDDADSILLRQDKDRTTRDVRSSMLADIEQTLAGLHMADQSMAPLLTDSSLTELTSTDTNKGNDDKIVLAEKRADIRKSNEPDNMSTTCQQSLFSENNVDYPSAAGKEATKVIPTAKPRKAPKVSPKPSPKARSKLRCHDDTTALKTPSETLNSISFTSSCELKLDDTSSALTINSTSQPPDKAAELTDVRPSGATNTVVDATSDNESTTNTDQTLSQARSKSPPGAAHTNLMLSEKQKYEDNERSSSTSSSSQVSTSSDTAKLITDISLEKDNIVEHNTSIHAKNRADAHPRNQENPDSHNYFSNGEETESSTYDQAIKNDHGKPTTRSSSTDEAVESAARQASPDRKTTTSQYGATRRSRSEETGKQRRESSEDQTGKGKTSKIPVRAGSKARSSSPKMLSGEKLSSPAN